MSTPTTSTGPTPPSGTSNPVPLRGWFKSIIDWIVGLSPTGATVYDTGWIDVALTGGATFNVQPQVRRIGQVVYWRGDVQRAHTTTFAEVMTAAAIPSWALPARSFRDATFTLPVMNLPNITALATFAGGYGLRLATSSSTTGSVLLAGLSGYTVN